MTSLVAAEIMSVFNTILQTGGKIDAIHIAYRSGDNLNRHNTETIEYEKKDQKS